MPKSALGRGLGALLGEDLSSTPDDAERTAAEGAGVAGKPGARVRQVALDQIRPGAFQPRREFSESSLKELASSIREQGIIQPLLVREQGDHLELIAGERRWRAARLLKLDEVPVIVRSAEDEQALELAMVENLQRDNLSPLEEAQGYAQLIESFKLRQEDVAEKVGKSRAAVANALRLLKLSEPVQALLKSGRISVGHAKVILGLADPKSQELAAQRIIKDQLNVRQTEELVSSMGTASTSPEGPAKARKSTTTEVASHIGDLESQLRERFGTKVSLQYRHGKGAVQIRFFSDADLERILRLAGVEID